eukprot:1158439-Pelagomonas_calceolata.AAC.3
MAKAEVVLPCSVLQGGEGHGEGHGQLRYELATKSYYFHYASLGWAANVRRDATIDAFPLVSVEGSTWVLIFTSSADLSGTDKKRQPACYSPVTGIAAKQLIHAAFGSSHLEPSTIEYDQMQHYGTMPYEALYEGYFLTLSTARHIWTAQLPACFDVSSDCSVLVLQPVFGLLCLEGYNMATISC